MKTAIYCRISRDRDGAGVGVDRQEQDCRALIDRLGWTVTRVFTDNDLSAHSGRVRPAYRKMLAAIERGDLQAVVAWHPDRLHRRAAELEEFVAIAEEHQTAIQTVSAGNVDLSTSSGRMVARMLGAAAQHEVDRTRERIKSAKTQAALEGKHRGGPRPFGWESDGMTVRPVEAAALLKAAHEVLAGRTLAAISREMDEQGLRTSTGRRWGYTALRTALCRPRNAGLVSHGRAYSPDLVIAGPGQWPAIIPEDVWRATRDLLMDPSRRSNTTTEKRWLGSGLYRCGLCGGPLRVTPYWSNKTTRKWLYRCVESPHLTYSQHEADETVLGIIRARLADPELARLIQPKADKPPPGLVPDREELRARLAMFDSDYAQGVITGTQLARATARVTAEIEQINQRLATYSKDGALAQLAGAVDPVTVFDGLPLDAVRAVLDALMVVTIAPSGRGRRLGPARVQVEWRTG